MQTNTTRSSNHLRACPAGATVGFTLMAVVAAGVAGVAQGQSAVGWGSNAFGQRNQPASPGQLRDISLGTRHVSALRTDGTVVCWGHDGFNQVGGLPTDLNSVVALHAGDNHTIALRADGSVVCWGDNIFGQSDVPPGLAPAVGVSAGEGMSGVLHADGTVTLWGWDSSDGRLNVPAGLGAVTKLELGMTFGTVLRTDGTVRYWGNFAPSIDTSAVLRDIAAGYGHAVGLRPDGTVQAWGANGSGQATAPAGLSGVAAVAAGRLHSLALKQDGSVVCWGSNARGQAPNPSPVTANGQQVAAGEEFSYGLTLAGGIAAPSITLVAAIDPTCGLANGSIDTTVANADRVFWTGPSGFFLNGADLTGLSAGAYTVTAVGKGGSVSQTVTLTAESDTTAPVVSSYDAAESAAAGLACTALVPDFTASVVASDNCTATGALVVAQSPAAGTALGLGAHDITITVTDGSDNVATVTAVFTVTGTAVTYFVDADGDSFGAGTGVVYCNTTTPPGYATNNADCDDMRLLYADGDGDNFGAGAPVACGVALNTDCNDANNQVYPGRTEVCNGVDDNCAGGIDDGLVFNTYYVDSDNDGFGLRGSTGTSSCDRIAGAATNDADCNDGNAAINPKATEFCDAGNVDEDCDNAADNADASASEATKSDFYLDADADTYGAGAAVRFCDLPAGHSVNSADCNDAVAAINPAAAEICDAANTDENCNGTADNGDSGALDAGKTNFYADADADTYTGSVVGRFCDLPASGWEPTSEGDCNDANATVYPGAAELCANDGIDNDCDGEANSDLESGDATPYYLDTDRDGFGAGTAVRSCTAIAGRVANNLDCDDTKLLYRDNDGDGFGAGAPVACGVTTNTDCNDASNAVYPGALENCANDGTDNDCDGEANSDAEAIDSVSYYVDGDQDGFGAGAATKSCTSIAGSVTNNADCDDTKLLYADNDGDTYGAGNPVACGVASNTDCNDASNAVYPGAVENCANDGTDNDCDGEANSDAEAVDSVSYFVDGDQDGFGAGAETKSCTAIAGSVTNNSDCNDAQKFFQDNDGDGFGSTICVPCGGATNNADCDDDNEFAYPKAQENCANDGTDNDCDGEANSDAEAVDSTGYFVDGDADGFGAGAETKSCTAIAGSVTNDADCDDTKLLYADNDGDTFGAGAPVACGVVTNTDCNDASNAVYPGALENCANDGIDNNCDGEANSDAEAVDSVDYYVDADSDTFGFGSATKSCTPIAGSVTNNADCDDTQLLYADNDADTYGAGTPVACGVESNTDCNDASNAVYPGALENCANDGTDNDCDGDTSADEAVDSVDYYVDADGDTFGAGTAVRSCTAIAGRVANNLDCDDTKLLYRDNDGDGFGAGAPVACGVTTNTDCNDANPTIYPGAFEACGDSLDNNCSGAVDEGCAPFTVILSGSASAFAPGDPFVVRAMCTAPTSEMSGAQLTLHFDPTRLRLDAVDPVAPAGLNLEIVEQINNTAGTLRYALGMSEPSDPLSGAADLCDLTFTVLPGADLCGAANLVTFGDVGAFTTRFTRFDNAAPVVPALTNLPPINLDSTPPVLTGVPAADITVATDAGSTFGALVSLPTVTAVDACEGDVAVTVTGAIASGLYPIGTTTVTWSATDSVGNAVSVSRDIVVGDYQLLDARISFTNRQLGASNHAFRIAVGSTVQVIDAVMPAWAGSVPSVATVAGIQVPVSAGYDCATAKSVAVPAGGSPQRWSHTITDAAPVSIAGARYSASFSLVPGDSNDDDMVEILDYGNFVVDRSSPANPSSAAEARSNYDGDNLVTNSDFGVFSAYFFRVGESCTPPLHAPQPRARVSVKELRRMGRGDLAAADINRDGWLDTRDMQLYLQGGSAGGSVASPEAAAAAPGW